MRNKQIQALDDVNAKITPMVSDFHEEADKLHQLKVGTPEWTVQMAKMIEKSKELVAVVPSSKAPNITPSKTIGKSTLTFSPALKARLGK